MKKMKNHSERDSLKDAMRGNDFIGSNIICEKVVHNSIKNAQMVFKNM